MPEYVQWGFGDFVDAVKAIQMRKWRIACNPKDGAEAVAALEQVAEHERWTLAESPQLELHEGVPRFRIGFFDPETRKLTGMMETALNTDRGLARLKDYWLPGRFDGGKGM